VGTEVLARLFEPTRCGCGDFPPLLKLQICRDAAGDAG